jgi:ribonucleoside-diphosphate reductase beta chain
MIDYSNANPLELQNKGIIPLFDTTGYFNVSRYPWAFQAFKRQNQIHWLGEEVPMGEDIKDWNGDELKDNERNLLTQIFRFFTQSDVSVSDNYFERYTPIFKPLEIKMMLGAFINSESIHIDSYSLLINTLAMPESEFKAFRQYGQMMAKVDYMDSFGTSTVKDLLKTLAMFGAFTEGLSLFASFAMLMNFPRFNKMKGMGQIVTWSVRDESGHCESLIRLFHTLLAESNIPLKSIEDDIIEICKTTVLLEDKFIELAFNLGDVQGMTQQDIKNYIRYIADWRLTQLNLTPVHGYFEGSQGQYVQKQEHPLPWLTAMLNGVEHANFFEARATEYSKSATKGNWNDTWGLFKK